MKRFTTTGNCIPDKHYMVDMSAKLAQIQDMVDYGDYFTINRARQYGKTTTLGLLEKLLQGNYNVARMSFEGIGSLGFETADKFAYMFMDKMRDTLNDDAWFDDSVHDFVALGKHVTKMCSGKKNVLMIDEVDKTSDNQIFLHFLGLLRSKYLDRNEGKDITFHSVILASVVDIKNIKIVMEQKGLIVRKEGEGNNNSPWNIAADFEVDMSFSPTDIATMLQQYEDDHNTGMDIATISQEIYNYTNGYPFLVSRICQHIDGKLKRNWTPGGVQAAVKILLKENNTLFDDIYKNMANYKDLYDLLYDVLISGKPRTFALGSRPVNLGAMFGIIKETENGVAISNKIFESVICKTFIADDEIRNPDKQITGILKEDIIHGGKFDMALCIEKFAKHYYSSFSDRDLEFYERHGRLLFLAYLQPLINGTGFYHIEGETRNSRRMDVIVDYGADQFIVELKLWSGDSDHDKAYTQLLDYMDSRNTADGYLLTFDFRLDINKQRKAEWVMIDNKRIFDVVV